MTSDFYVVSSDKKYSQLALQAKYTKDLTKPIELLKTEQAHSITFDNGKEFA